MIHYYRYLFVKKKVFNYSELDFFRSDFLQNPYFKPSTYALAIYLQYGIVRTHARLQNQNIDQLPISRF